MITAAEARQLAGIQTEKERILEGIEKCIEGNAKLGKNNIVYHLGATYPLDFVREVEFEFIKLGYDVYFDGQYTLVIRWSV